MWIFASILSKSLSWYLVLLILHPICISCKYGKLNACWLKMWLMKMRQLEPWQLKWKKNDKYWSDYSMVLSFGCILDPRFKFGFLRFCYSKLGLDLKQSWKLWSTSCILYTMSMLSCIRKKKQPAMLLQVKVHHKGLHLLILLLVESHQHHNGLLWM